MVGFARLQRGIGLRQVVAPRLAARKHRRRADQHGNGEKNSHCTTWMGIPICKGCPDVVPVATTSPSFRPERMPIWVRFSDPVTTGVRTKLLLMTLNTYGLPFSE